MDLQQIRRSAIAPALALLPAKMSGARAEVQMLAIGLQESRFEHRRQIGGPAVGFWQFEQGGGVRGVLTHPASREHAQSICRARGIPASASAVYAALMTDDVLAAAFARLLLWTDPAALPAVGAVATAWDLYLRTWRPGKPHPDSWKGLYMQAMAAVTDGVTA
jgi:hypothetical protein